MPLPAGYEIEKESGGAANLPAGYQMESTEPANTEARVQKHGEIRKGPPFWKYKASDIFREGAKALGFTAGAAAGAAATPELGGAGSVPGAGLGYATAQRGADVFDRLIGVTPNRPNPISNQLRQTGKDILHGATIEAGGQVAGPFIQKGANALSNAFLSPTRRAEEQAGNLLNKAYQAGPEEEINMLRASELQKRTGKPLALTRAQQTGSKRAGMFEQSLASQSEIADPLSRMDSATRQTSLERLLNTLGSGAKAPEKVMEQPSGRKVVERIQAAYAPVKQAETEAYAAIPKYEMPTTNLDEQITALKAEPMAKQAKGQFNNAVAYIKNMGKDTVSMREVSKSLGNDIRKYQKAGDLNTARPLSMLKSAIDKDLEALGEAAQTGGIAVHEGKLVYPEKLQAELVELTPKIEAERAKSITDVPATAKALTEKGIPAMRQTGESEAAFNFRITSAYQKAFGTNPPVKPSPQLTPMIERKAAIENTLAKMQPAEDANAAIKNAVALSRSKFERFKRGAVGEVRRPGDEINQLRIEDEKIRRQFGNVSGYQSLVRAIGKEDAKDMMRSYFTNEMRGDGEEFNIKTALNFYRKNQEVLRAAGLSGEMRDIIKGEIPNELKRKLATKRLESGSVDKPYFTAQEARSILNEYGGILRATYGPAPVQALRDYHEILTRQGWNKNQSYGGGSVTAEKFLNNPEWFLKEGETIPHPLKRVASIFLDVLATSGGAAAGAAMHGWEGAAMGSAGGFALRRGYTEVRRDAANRVLQLLREAVIDPSKAELLMKVAKTKKDTTARDIAAQGIAKLGKTATAAFTGREREEQYQEGTP